MNDLERRCWEDYQKNLPKGLGEHNERIIKILDWVDDQSFKIMSLNDMLRSTGIGWDILVTSGIQALKEDYRNRLISAIINFNQFTPDNDPYWEHDFWSVTLDNQNSFFKIDYYDENREYGSKEPSNPSVTSRVMTIMLASEY